MKKTYSAPVINSIELESDTFMRMSDTLVGGVHVIQTDFYEDEIDELDLEDDFL